MKINERIFKIEDVDCEVIVEVVNKQKDILDNIEQYIENLEYDWFDASDDSFEIIYKDGSEEYIDNNYDGHKIRKNNILSMVHNNACTSIVYGNFAMNEYGVVTAAETETIATENIKEM